MVGQVVESTVQATLLVTSSGGSQMAGGGREVESEGVSEALRASMFPVQLDNGDEALGHVSDRLTGRQRRHFLDILEAYRNRLAPLSAPQAVLASWGVRFEVPYLAGQTFLEPYPAELARHERITKRKRRSLRQVPSAAS